MRKVILPVCLLCCSLGANAQDSKWGISFTPAVVQSPTIKYGLQAGAEYRINERLSILTEIAFSTGHRPDSSFRDAKYFRIKPELRYHLFETWRGRKAYGGIQFSYSYRKWKDLNGGCYFTEKQYNDSTVSYDKADIKSPIFTSSLQFGTLIPIITDQLYLDLFAGMGVRVIFTDYSGVEDPVKAYSNGTFCKIVPTADPAYWINNTVSRFHCNFGVRFLYRF